MEAHMTHQEHHLHHLAFQEDCLMNDTFLQQGKKERLRILTKKCRKWILNTLQQYKSHDLQQEQPTNQHTAQIGKVNSQNLIIHPNDECSLIKANLPFFNLCHNKSTTEATLNFPSQADLSSLSHLPSQYQLNQFQPTSEHSDEQQHRNFILSSQQPLENILMPQSPDLIFLKMRAAYQQYLQLTQEEQREIAELELENQTIIQLIEQERCRLFSNSNNQYKMPKGSYKLLRR